MWLLPRVAHVFLLTQGDWDPRSHLAKVTVKYCQVVFVLIAFMGETDKVNTEQHAALYTLSPSLCIRVYRLCPYSPGFSWAWPLLSLAFTRFCPSDWPGQFSSSGMSALTFSVDRHIIVPVPGLFLRKTENRKAENVAQCGSTCLSHPWGLGLDSLVPQNKQTNKNQVISVL